MMLEKKKNEIKLRSLNEARKLAKSVNSPAEKFQPIRLTNLKEARDLAKSSTVRPSSVLDLHEKLMAFSPSDERTICRNFSSVSPKQDTEFSDPDTAEKEGKMNESLECVGFARLIGIDVIEELEHSRRENCEDDCKETYSNKDMEKHERISECSEKKEDDTEKTRLSIEKQTDVPEKPFEDPNNLKNCESQIKIENSSENRIIEAKIAEKIEEQGSETQEHFIHPKILESKSDPTLNEKQKKDLITPRKQPTGKRKNTKTKQNKINLTEIKIKPIPKKIPERPVKNDGTVLKFIDEKKGEKKLSKSQERTLLDRLQGNLTKLLK